MNPKKRCPNFRRYKGLLPPRCNFGKGCRDCWDKYLARDAKGAKE
jgi:hypothetical protein